MTVTRVATWNVNSIRARLDRLLAWLESRQPDIVSLQETKSDDGKFPEAELREAGYHAVFTGQKTYNGVAILSRIEAENPILSLPGAPEEEKRFVAATVGGLRIICVYVPNGQSAGSEKWQGKLRWLERLEEYVRADLQTHPDLLLMGDMNIAPEDRDVHDPEAWRDENLCTQEERTAYRRLLDLDLTDAYRLFEHPEKERFTWWDYRMLGFPKNLGLRIDHILVSSTLRERIQSCRVDREERKGKKPSDHAPVILELR